MYAGPLASVIFQKRFPDQKQGRSKKKNNNKKKKQYSQCEINPVPQTQPDQII